MCFSSSVRGREVLSGVGLELNLQRWWWWSGQQRHMCPRIPWRTRPEISERCNSSKILIFSEVDAFLHSSVLNLKMRFQRLNFQLFQTWTTSKVDYDVNSYSATVQRKKEVVLTEKQLTLCIMIKDASWQWCWEHPLSMMIQRAFPRVRLEVGTGYIFLVCN